MSNNTSLKEYNKARKDYLKKKKIVWGIICGLFVLSILLIKIFLGTLNIPNVFGYSKNKSRFYYVTINDNQIGVSYTLRHRLKIIPSLVNIDSYYLGNNYVNGNLNYYAHDEDQYLISIKSFNCYYQDKYRVECSKNSQEMKENFDTKYTHLKITHITNPYEVIYDEDFINDITSYINSKGQYDIEITAEYSHVETKIYFYLEK